MAFEHANDAAMGNLGYARAPLDHYPTPVNVTYALMPFLRQHYTGADVWEPACGNGAIADILSTSGYTVLATDIHDWGCANYQSLDFLKTDISHACVVTNPPYALAEEFCRQAIKLTKSQRGVVAMLLRHEFDCASGRNDLFNQHPFCRKVTLLFRPRWIPDSTGAPRHTYAWYLFDWTWAGEPVLSYAKRP